jgi:hypothetical protein
VRQLLLVLLLVLAGCHKGTDHAPRPRKARATKTAPTAVNMRPIAPTTPAVPAAPLDPDEEGDGTAEPATDPTAAVAAGDEAAAAVLLPDSEPAGAPFASTVASAVAEVTQQGGTSLTSRVYRAALEQARREITADNARAKLRDLEKQIDAERQAQQ